MKSKFMRLYRELSLSEPDKKIRDLSYTKDRVEVFELIAQDRSGKTSSSVPRPLKHHGKLARQRRLITQRVDKTSERDGDRERSAVAASLAPSADNPGNEIVERLRSRRVKMQEQIARDMAQYSAESTHSETATPSSSSSNKLEKQRRLNHASFKHEQSKTLILSQLKPLVDKQERVPKRVVQRLLSLENRLSSTEEKHQNAAETHASLGLRSSLRIVDELVGPSTALAADDLNASKRALRKTSLSPLSPKHSTTQKERDSLSISESLRTRIRSLSAKEDKTRRKYVPTEHHTTRLHDKSYSVNPHSKWSDEERERMRRLLLEMPLPSSTFNKLDQAVNAATHNQILNANQVELWRLYLEHFSDRFQAFHPQRSRKEIENKLRSVIAKKQFKAQGEEQHWRFVQHKGHQGQDVPAAPRASDSSSMRDERLRQLEMEMI